VQEFIQGQNLAEVLKAEGTFNEAQKCFLRQWLLLTDFMS
jgi:hypothetical protein